MRTALVTSQVIRPGFRRPLSAIGVRWAVRLIFGRNPGPIKALNVPRTDPGCLPVQT
jgi:hypothetical protein